MYILGINGNLGRESHDPAAVLVKNGEVLFAIEEERINRIKHSPGKLPINAIKRVLELSSIEMTDVSYIAFPQNSWGQLFKDRLISTINHWFGCCPEIRFYNHHLCHGASAYYASGIEKECLALNIDGSGDGISISSYVFNREKYKVISETKFPNSLGLLYSIITQYLGFEKNNEEYKVMSLAALGSDNNILNNLIKKNDFEKIEVKSEIQTDLLEKMKFPFYLTKQEPFYNEETLKLYCHRRIPGSDIKKEHMDLAADLQRNFENLVIEIIENLKKETKLDCLVLSGGSMLNCKFVGELLKKVKFDKFYLPPFPDDSGNAFGAAYLCSIENGFYPQKLLTPFLGDYYSDESIKCILETCKINYIYVEDKAKDILNQLANDRIIANFSGGMEFGPRALGNRSILANVHTNDITHRLNSIKKRYIFQPFAIAVLDEDAKEYLKIQKFKSPYMNIIFDVKEEKYKNLKNVVHADGTIRVQTITEEHSSLFPILSMMKKEELDPIIINTSFNRKGEPIVRTPEDAIATFFSTGIDVLYLNNYKIIK